MNHLAEKQLVMPLILILLMYPNHPNYITSKYIQSKKLLYIYNTFASYSKWDHLNFFSDMKHEHIPKRLLIHFISHIHWLHIQKPRMWHSGWLLDWIIEIMYGIIYMFPATRSMKTGRKTLTFLLARFRFYRGLEINNLIATKDSVKYKVGSIHLPNMSMVMKKHYFVSSIVILILLVHIFDLSAILSIIPFAFGVNYYIDADGGDDNDDGLADVTAWATFDHIYGLTGNHSIYLKRATVAGYSYTGGVYCDIQLSGGLGTEARISAYGAGALPVLDEATLGTSGAAAHIIFEYLNVDGAVASDGIVSNGAQYITMQHNTITHVDRWGLIALNGDNSYLYVYDNLLNDGYITNQGHATYHSHNTEIAVNTLNNSSGDAIQIHEGGSASAYMGATHTVHDNVVNTSNNDNCDLTSGNAILVYDNQFDDPGGWGIFLDDVTYDVEIYRNRMDSHIIIMDRIVKFWGNLVVDNSIFDRLLFVSSENSESQIVYGVEIYKNTFVTHLQSATRGIFDIADTYNNFHATNSALKIKWNIISTDDATFPPMCIQFQHATFLYDDARFEADYNIWGPGTFNCSSTSDRTWANWQTAGNDANGLNTDPYFKDRTGEDFHLQRIVNGDAHDSPALGLGPPTGTYHPDIDGVNSQLDAGAYESVGGPTPITKIEFKDVSLTNVVIEN